MAIEFNLKGQIDFAKDYQISIPEDITFNDGGLPVILSPSEDGLIFSITINAADESMARAIAETKLLKITNLISWFHNIPITWAKVTGMSYKNNKNDFGITETVWVTDRVFIKKGLNPESLKKLSQNLERDYEPEFEETILMWKEALAQESAGLKFFLLYRVLENVLGKRTLVDAWIKDKYPETEIAKGQRNEDITIYTYLRDNIHAKSIFFPFAKIESMLPQLQDLTRKAIEEKWSTAA